MMSAMRSHVNLRGSKFRSRGPISRKFPRPVEDPPGPPWSHKIVGHVVLAEDTLLGLLKNHQNMFTSTKANPQTKKSTQLGSNIAAIRYAASLVDEIEERV